MHFGAGFSGPAIIYDEALCNNSEQQSPAITYQKDSKRYQEAPTQHSPSPPHDLGQLWENVKNSLSWTEVLHITFFAFNIKGTKWS